MNPVSVPETGTLALLIVGVVVGFAAWRKRIVSLSTEYGYLNRLSRQAFPSLDLPRQQVFSSGD